MDMPRTNIFLIILGVIVGLEAVVSIVLLRQVSQLRKAQNPYPTEAVAPTGLTPTIITDPTPAPTTMSYATPYPTYNPKINPMPSYMLTIYPTQAVQKLPADIQDAYSWPIQELCAIPKHYSVYYQLDDGSNIYKVSTGGYVRGKPMLCTN